MVLKSVFILTISGIYLKHLSVNSKFADFVMTFDVFFLMLNLICNTPIPLDGVSATFRNYGQNDTKRGRNAKSAAKTPRAQ